eukprot:Em0019g1182a
MFTINMQACLEVIWVVWVGWRWELNLGFFFLKQFQQTYVVRATFEPVEVDHLQLVITSVLYLVGNLRRILYGPLHGLCLPFADGRVEQPNHITIYKWCSGVINDAHWEVSITSKHQEVLVFYIDSRGNRFDTTPEQTASAQAKPEGQVARWPEQLQELNFKIIHRPGQRHQNVDALSRLPCKQCGHTGEDDKNNESATIATLQLSASYVSANIKDKQMEDQER